MRAARAIAHTVCGMSVRPQSARSPVEEPTGCSIEIADVLDELDAYSGNGAAEEKEEQ
jgi:hypothetical protein